MYFGVQPSSRRILSALATSAGGSPARRGPSFTGDCLARHLFEQCDHFADAVAAADADVVRQAGSRPDLLQREDVRGGQVIDVDVVADAGAVGRRVVGAEDLDVRALAERGLEDERDQVRFGVVVLADGAVRRRRRRR